MNVPTPFIHALAGSHSYGTATEETTDQDIRGAYLAPREEILGLPDGRGQQYAYDDGKLDIVLYELGKFCALALKGNPNIIEVLFAKQVETTPSGLLFIDRLRPLVISQKIVSAAKGMAQAHLARISHPGRNCGIKGKDAIRKHGYNTKDACHTIRVLEEAKELCESGTITLPRPNVGELMSIRAGEFSKDYTLNRAEELFEQIEDVKDNLPERPNRKEVNALLVEEYSCALDQSQELAER